MDHQALKYYNNYKEVYKRPPHAFVPYVDLITKHYTPPEGGSILDIGCGFGDLLIGLRTHYGDKSSYHGLTIAKHEAAHIRKEHPFISLTEDLQQNLQNHYSQNQFDSIINFHTLSYIRQKEQLETLSNMLSILKPGGLLVLATIDHWIKLSCKVAQHQEGYVQFFYSPWLFALLEKHATLIYSSNKNPNGYRVMLWQKTPSAKKTHLTVNYILKNNILFFPFFKKVRKRLFSL